MYDRKRTIWLSLATHKGEKIRTGVQTAIGEVVKRRMYIKEEDVYPPGWAATPSGTKT